MEQPIRRGALRGRRLYATTAGVLAVTTGAVLVATTGEAPPSYAAPIVDGEEMESESLAEADLQGVETPFVAVPEEKDIPDDAVRLLLVGDSGAGALGWEAELLSADGAEIVFLTSPYTGTGREGMGREVDCRNATIQRAAAARPGTRVLDLNGFLLQHEDDEEEDWFVDPVHLSAHGARVVSDWLVPQVAAWAREQQISGDTPGG